MQSRHFLCLMPAIALLFSGCCLAAADDPPALDRAALDKAFEALKSFDNGQNLKVLQPIDAAVVAAHGDAAVGKDLETRLAAILPTDASRIAKDFVCRKLTIVGTAASVPALAALLTDNENSHMARYALERMPAPEAAKALQEALPKVGGALKVGVIGSLGVRRDAASVPSLAALLGDANKAIACAAACALGDIGDATAAKALLEAAKKSPDEVKASVADASLACAEHLLADGKKAEAMQVYKAFTGEDQPKHVRLAATRGLLSATQKNTGSR
jgi:HEAT repeat protein